MNLLLEKSFPIDQGIITFKVFDDKPDFDFVEVTQVHGATIVSPQDAGSKADGLLISYRDYSGAPLAIKTADCLPVAMIGKHGMALLHAGWKGVHQKILVSKELTKLEIQNIFIGPSIQKESYEVGPEFKEHFKDYPSSLEERGGRLTFNLPLAAEIQMREAFPKAKIEACGIDTFTTPCHNSYRKDKTPRRNYNLLYVKFSKP